MRARVLRAGAVRELPAGDDAVLLDFTAADDPAAAAARAANLLRSAAADGTLRIDDAISSAATVLVQGTPGDGLDVLAVRRVLRPDALAAQEDSTSSSTLWIPVHYDGADVSDVADHAGVSADAVIAAHTAIDWRVQFMGFAPGFGYLVPGDASPAAARAVFTALTRRPQSRPAVPAGSVAVAAGYSAVYPRSSPGGWFLLGRTDLAMWDAAATPPARLTAGMTVKFRCAD